MTNGPPVCVLSKNPLGSHVELTNAVPGDSCRILTYLIFSLLMQWLYVKKIKYGQWLFKNCLKQLMWLNFIGMTTWDLLFLERKFVTNFLQCRKLENGIEARGRHKLVSVLTPTCLSKVHYFWRSFLTELYWFFLK